MKRFIQHFLFFVSFFILLILLVKVGFFLFHINREKTQALSQNIIVFGHSHPECSINPDIVNDSDNTLMLINNGKGGQSYLWTIASARNAYKNGCRNFIFELTNNSFTTAWKTTDNERGNRELKKQYHLGLSEIIYITKNSTTQFLLNFFVKNYFNIPLVDGKYNRLNNEFISRVNKNENKIHNKQLIVKDFNTDLLMNFIHNHPNCQFLIYRAPLRPKYIRNPRTEQEVKNIFNKLEQEGIHIKDCADWYHSDEYFHDLDHMSGYGSDVFSDSFSNTIKHVFETSTPQQSRPSPSNTGSQ